MLEEIAKKIKKTFGKYTLKLNNLLLLTMIFVVLSGCLGLYGLTRFQEGLVPQKGESTPTIPKVVLEPGTGRPIPSVNTGGIPVTQIPQDNEDMYILKSQIVPPVCPKCPSVINKCDDKQNEKKCPPCPACARCPEPSFECKKVPNYSSTNENLPLPLVNNFGIY